MGRDVKLYLGFFHIFWARRRRLNGAFLGGVRSKAVDRPARGVRRPVRAIVEWANRSRAVSIFARGVFPERLIPNENWHSESNAQEKPPARRCSPPDYDWPIPR